MKYRLEFHPNHDCITIHLQMRVCNKMIESFESPEDKIMVWEDNEIISHEDPPLFVKRLWEVVGIDKISLHAYSIHLVKGTAFNWNDMLERIIAILNLELFPNDEPVQLAKPKKPSRVLLKHLRQHGCDV